MWLSAQFMGDEELLKCKLQENMACCGRNNVRLTFTWKAEVSYDDDQARLKFLRDAAKIHPDDLQDVADRVQSRVPIT